MSNVYPVKKSLEGKTYLAGMKEYEETTFVGSRIFGFAVNMPICKFANH